MNTSSKPSIDVALGAADPLAIDVRAVADHARARPAAPSSREALKVHRLPVERRLVDLEVARVQHDAGRRVDRHRDAVGHAVRHAQELDREAPDRDAIARADLGQPRADLRAVLLELRLEERERQLRAVDRAVEVPEHVRHRADVVLVPVRQHQRLDAVALQQRPHVRDDQIDAEQVRLGEHDAGVHEDRRVAAGDEHHVHAELAEPAERDQFERRRAWPPCPDR